MAGAVFSWQRGHVALVPPVHGGRSGRDVWESGIQEGENSMDSTEGLAPFL